MVIGSPEAYAQAMKALAEERMGKTQMKWEQIFVAYSDCGQYKIEVEETDGVFDWAIYRDAVDDFSELEEDSTPFTFESSSDARAEAEKALSKILAEDKKREAPVFLDEAAPGGYLFGIRDDLPLWRASNARLTPTQQKLYTSFREWKEAKEATLGAGCACGAYRGSHMSDCPVLHSAMNQDLARVVAENASQKILEAVRTGDFSEFESKASPHLIGQVDTEYLVCKEHDAWSTHKDAFCSDCGRDASLSATVERLAAIKPKEKSGYDQILATIKNESKEIEL